MNVKYDKQVDALYLKFSEAKIEESEEERPGFIIDYDKDGNVVGIEMLDASKKTNLNEFSLQNMPIKKELLTQ